MKNTEDSMKNWHSDNSGCLYAQTYNLKTGQLEERQIYFAPQSEVITLLIDITPLFDIIGDEDLNSIIADFSSIEEFVLPAFHLAERKIGTIVQFDSCSSIISGNLVVNKVLEVLSDCIVNHFTTKWVCDKLMYVDYHTRKDNYGNITEGTLYVRGEFTWYPSTLPVLNSH